MQEFKAENIMKFIVIIYSIYNIYIVSKINYEGKVCLLMTIKDLTDKKLS